MALLEGVCLGCIAAVGGVLVGSSADDLVWAGVWVVVAVGAWVATGEFSERHADMVEGYHPCKGASLALPEVRLCVASLARRFRPRRLPGPSVEPAVTSTHTPGGLRMRLVAW